MGLPAIAGAAGLSALGGILDAKGTKDAARIAAEAGRFAPIDIMTGLGSVTSGPEGITTQLSPEMLALQQQLFGLGQQGLQQFQTFDPTQAGQLFTQRLGAAAAPIEQRQRQELENRLFKQGLLTSSGGAERMGALTEAQSQAELQRQLAGMQYGTQEQERLFQNALGAYQAGTGLEQLSEGLLPQYAGIGGRATEANQFGARLGFQAGQTRADMLSSFFGNLGQGLANYSFGSTSPTTSYSGSSLFNVGITPQNTSSYDIFGPTMVGR